MLRQAFWSATPFSYQLADSLQHFRAFSVQRGNFVHDFLRTKMHNFLSPVWIFHRKVECDRINSFDVYTPTLRRVPIVFLQLHKLGEIVIVQWVGFAEVPAGV